MNHQSRDILGIGTKTTGSVNHRIFIEFRILVETVVFGGLVCISES
jgi:hypothetical protein